MLCARPGDTLMVPNLKLSADLLEDIGQYRRLIGKLIL